MQSRDKLSAPSPGEADDASLGLDLGATIKSPAVTTWISAAWEKQNVSHVKFQVATFW